MCWYKREERRRTSEVIFLKREIMKRGYSESCAFQFGNEHETKAK